MASERQTIQHDSRQTKDIRRSNIFPRGYGTKRQRETCKSTAYCYSASPTQDREEAYCSVPQNSVLHVRCNHDTWGCIAYPYHAGVQIMTEHAPHKWHHLLNGWAIDYDREICKVCGALRVRTEGHWAVPTKNGLKVRHCTRFPNRDTRC